MGAGGLSPPSPLTLTTDFQPRKPMAGIDMCSVHAALYQFLCGNWLFIFVIMTVGVAQLLSANAPVTTTIRRPFDCLSKVIKVTVAVTH